MNNEGALPPSAGANSFAFVVHHAGERQGDERHQEAVKSRQPTAAIGTRNDDFRQRYGATDVVETGVQSTAGGTAGVRVVLSDGDLSKSNRSSRALAFWSRLVRKR